MISYSEGTMVQHDTGPGTAQSKTMSEIGDFVWIFLLLLLALTQCSSYTYIGTMVACSDDHPLMEESTKYDTMVLNYDTMVVNDADYIGPIGAEFNSCLETA